MKNVPKFAKTFNSGLKLLTLMNEWVYLVIRSVTHDFEISRRSVHVKRKTKKRMKQLARVENGTKLSKKKQFVLAFGAW